ncbi:MAG: hypothetical protein COU29_00575 [Candidatus Magasanikbacteria bacterium CG10_big_fil_rev_8_21_14_0_10_36_32]|uniref:Uncharacterized protein n=1 Tax=Candidatus Magasanikbacteria bacterium CG10_big_fil_rev_8_21_14_0_10_36_32 TaxID=1974646 RepID=A0A2M6W7E2_9BACT|nr:MAG: hypothetical protein COU29_00575 [Candidatus Magasanikbacteria bacterium CG10_big_fil_rev_8_21_14_0_10_36_32]
MTTLRTRIFIIFSIFFLFVLAVSIILIVINKQKQAVIETTSTPSAIDFDNFTQDKISAPAAQVTPTQGITVKQPTTEEQMKNAAKQIAKIFVERYGTYSTDNNFSNIKELDTMCSRDLWSVLSSRITDTQVNNGFVGVTTKAVTSVITSWQTDKAIVEITTVRTETKDGVTSSKNQKATVTLVNVQNNWLVDDAKWGQ